ncbi:MAG: hypothetical protein LC725_08090 [Lentisphaerae bacterium]|nr:hypothetical protein [Lentisphaerota bacterium]
MMHIPFDDTTTAALLGVSVRTVADWRAGRRHPGPTAARLLDLHQRGQVIPDRAAWYGYAFDGGTLVCDNGQRLHPAQIGQFRLFFDMLNNAHADLQAARAELARQDEYIRMLEGKNAAANAARIVPLFGE